MRAVVSTRSAHRHEDDDEDGDGERDRHRVRAQQPGLHAPDLASDLERPGADLVERALDDGLLDVPAERDRERRGRTVEERVVQLVEVELVLEDAPDVRGS